jgi:hypothetical protein
MNIDDGEEEVSLEKYDDVATMQRLDSSFGLHSKQSTGTYWV